MIEMWSCYLRKMLGDGGNSNTSYPILLEENCFISNLNTQPQMKLFGEFPVGFGVNPISYMNTVDASGATFCARKRTRDGKPLGDLQKLHTSLNNPCQDEAGCEGNDFTPNPVSTGLRLSYGEEEHNSSITNTSENFKTVAPAFFSLGNSIKIEIERQKKELDNYINVQEENILKGIRELNQRHMVFLLNSLEKAVSRKLHEKVVEIGNMNRKNKELEERIKQVTVEAQTWHYQAKYNESLVNALKSNIQQLLARGTLQVKEGCGDSELDDAASSINNQGIVGGSGNQLPLKQQLNCRACKSKEVSVLLLPCRHLCLCNDCEAFAHVCPICQVMKTASVQVIMS